MKIFLPFQKDLNPYLEEIAESSAHTFIYGSRKDYKISYQVVNIHWPEALFDWKEPSEQELKELEQEIYNWKEHSLFVYTKHDFQRNKGTTEGFTRLFRLIEENADAFIHLGKFSKNFYEAQYPDVAHYIVYHPLYLNSFSNPKKAEAREKLNIARNALVIIAPGNIRSYDERDLVLKAFKSMPHKNKVLIATNVHSEIRYEFPGRVRLKEIFDVKKFMVRRFREKHKAPQYIFTYHHIPQEELEFKMAAADVVFVPRIEILNSGTVFLGLTFKKPMAGPACGNIKEQLTELGYPVFNPGDSRSVNQALKKVIELYEQKVEPDKKLLEKYESSNVAAVYDRIISEIIENEA